MRIEEEVKLDYDDVLIRPKRSTLTSRKEVNLIRDFHFKNSKRDLSVIPIIASNMHGVGTFQMAKSFAPHRMMVALHKYYSVSELKKFFKSLSEKDAELVFYTMGTAEADVKKLDALLKELPHKAIKNICIDVANGYMERFVDFVRKMRERFPDKIIMAGNVVTGEMAEELSLSGADIVKIGIGPGSVCITRKIAGVGYPQLSAVIECADSAHGIGTRICADGGCQSSGDVVKAVGGGGDFVMLGGMFAGHDESEQKPIKKGNKKIIEYFGPSSEEAMLRYHGGIENYRASEGKMAHVEYRGSVIKTIQEMLGGLRSACTYVGARNLRELSKRTTFIRVNKQLNTFFGE